MFDRRDFPGLLGDYETYQQSAADRTDKLVLIYVILKKISSSIWLKEEILSQFWEVYLKTIQKFINCQVVLYCECYRQQRENRRGIVS